MSGMGELVDYSEEFDPALCKPTLDGFVRILRQRYKLANVAYVCAGFCSGNAKDGWVAATTYGDEWAAHYQEQGYARVDPVIASAARSVLPVDWAYLPRTRRKVYRMFEEAREAGIGSQGLTIPVRGPVNGVWGFLTATSFASAEQWQAQNDELARNLFFDAYKIHQLAFTLYGGVVPAHDMSTLSEREIEVLQQIANGAKISDIAVLMGVTANTVKTYLAAIRVKLRAFNSPHAVCIALRAGLIR